MCAKARSCGWGPLLAWTTRIAKVRANDAAFTQMYGGRNLE